MLSRVDEILEIKGTIRERTESAAISIAKTLVQKLGIKTYPVPIVSILNELGFSLFAANMQNNKSGMIVISPDLLSHFNTDKVIVIDKLDTIGRQRFTLAHEFAHYLFDFNEQEQYTFQSTYDMDKADTPEERVPSKFAAEFLMPEDLFRRRNSELCAMSNYSRVLQLVKDFTVTQTAVLRRLAELGLEDASEHT